MQVTDELRVLVEAEVARAIDNFKKLEGSVDEAEKKTKSLGDAIDSISKKAMLVSAAIGAAGIAAVKFAGENEKLKLSLKNMLGSAGEASSVFEEWRRLGNSPGLSTGEVVELGRAMVNMGHDTAYATRTIQMLGNVAAGTGKSFGTISGAFEHVRAQGKLTSRDLTNFQQQGIPVLKQLAKELNTSEEGVRRLVSEGKIGFPELERAFRGMTGPGGQFAGTMDELSGTVLERFSTATAEAKQALAAFGETMLPMAAGLLESATSVLRGITDMDEKTRRLIVSMGGLVAGVGGVIALSGPTIKAVKGINAAMATLAANPIILATVGITAGFVGLAAVVGDVNTKLNRAAKDYDTTIKGMAGNNRRLLESAGSFDEVSRKVKGLSRDMYNAALETGNFDAATAAASRLLALNQQLFNARERAEQTSEGIKTQARALISILEQPVNPEALHWLDGYATEIEKINAALEMLDMSGYGNLYKLLVEGTPGWAEAVTSQSTDVMLNILRNIDGKSPSAKAEIERIQNEINKISSGITLRPSESSQTEEKKRWQDWFGEITKIDPVRFGNSGAKAAELYLTEFNRSFEAGKNVFAALGEEFDIAGALRGQQADIQKTLVELFSIDPADIDAQFTVIDESIKPLIADYKRLGEAIKETEDAQKAAAAHKEYAQTIKDLKQKIADFGKSEAQLAYETALANKALPEQAEEIKRLMGEYQRTEILAEYQRQIDEIGKSQRELAMTAYAATGATEAQIAVFKNTFDLKEGLEQAEKLKETLTSIKDALVDLGTGATLTGIEAMGYAFGQGADAGDAMRDALVAMSQEILNALPNLFLQAGLQLIAQGQWPLGLGFIAAAGSTALIKGYVGGRIEAERDAAQNAHGNVFGSHGLVPYAHGGAFTNQIVNQPTYFRYGGALKGVMGEAGPEAIMPLKRMANGDLGIQTETGGGARVIVNVINNSGAEVHQEEHTGPDGDRQIDITIGEIVGAQIASGRHDSALESRFEGLKRRGR